MGWVSQSGGIVQRTDGTRTGADVWDEARLADINVNSGPHDTHDEDLADAIADCLHKGGFNSMTANLKMGSNKITGVGNGTASTDAVNKGQLDAAAPVFIAATDVGGTANAITLTNGGSLTTGKTWKFFAKNTNTDSVSITIDGGSELTCKRSDGEDFAGGEVKNKTYIEATYNGTDLVTNIGIRTEYITQAAYEALTGDEPYGGVRYYTRES